MSQFVMLLLIPKDVKSITYLPLEFLGRGHVSVLLGVERPECRSRRVPVQLKLEEDLVPNSINKFCLKMHDY